MMFAKSNYHNCMLIYYAIDYHIVRDSYGWDQEHLSFSVLCLHLAISVKIFFSPYHAAHINSLQLTAIEF